MICGFSISIQAQDKHTVLLYTFETGKGDTVKDHSGKGNDGKLMGQTGKQEIQDRSGIRWQC